MRIVLDANIIIAALLRSRATLTIITSLNHQFHAPQRVVDEIKKHRIEICEMTLQTNGEFDETLDALVAIIHLSPYADFEDFLPEATSQMRIRDPNDTDYIACALAINADFIWSNDKDFDAQNLVPVKTTDQFIEEGRT